MMVKMLATGLIGALVALPLGFASPLAIRTTEYGLPSDASVIACAQGASCTFAAQGWTGCNKLPYPATRTYPDGGLIEECLCNGFSFGFPLWSQHLSECLTCLENGDPSLLNQVTQLVSSVCSDTSKLPLDDFWEAAYALGYQAHFPLLLPNAVLFDQSGVEKREDSTDNGNDPIFRQKRQATGDDHDPIFRRDSTDDSIDPIFHHKRENSDDGDVLIFRQKRQITHGDHDLIFRQKREDSEDDDDLIFREERQTTTTGLTDGQICEADSNCKLAGAIFDWCINCIPDHTNTANWDCLCKTYINEWKNAVSGCTTCIEPRLNLNVQPTPLGFGESAMALLDSYCNMTSPEESTNVLLGNGNELTSEYGSPLLFFNMTIPTGPIETEDP